MRSLFITGTNTGVGKTGVAAAVAKLLHDDGLSVGVLKPAVSGVNERGRWDDVDALADAISLPEDDRDIVCPLRFDAPMAPPAAAAKQSQRVDVEVMDDAIERWRARCDWLVIEGAGGLLCPMTDEFTVADLVTRWNVPAVVVVGLELGAINHSLLTANVMQHRGIETVGWIFNETTPADDDERELRDLTRQDIESRSTVPTVATRSFQADHLRLPDGSRLVQRSDVTPWFR